MRCWRGAVVVAVVAASSLVTAGVGQATPTWSAVDLGTLGGSSSFATDISPSGEVVGWSSTAGDSDVHGFSWTRAGGMVDLGSLGGQWTYATHVSSSGQVIGSAGSRAFSWTPSTGLVDLGDLGGGYSFPADVNGSGTVVGVSSDADANQRAFIWTAAGGMRDLGTLGGSWSSAEAIAPSGAVTGFSALPGDASVHAFLWTRVSGMVDLGTLGGSSSFGVGIAANGAVVGTSELEGDTISHAFRWTAAGGMVDLGTLGREQSVDVLIAQNGVVAGQHFNLGPVGIPVDWGGFVWSAGQGAADIGGLGGYTWVLGSSNSSVVGYSEIAVNSLEVHAFVWKHEMGMIDLGVPLGGTQSQALAVDESGQVAGYSTLPGNQAAHAVLWQPAG